MLSRREKSILNGVELMFKGMEDDVLKEIVLATALQKTEEEQNKIIENIQKKKEEDMKYITEKFEIEINAENPTKMLELFKTYVEQNPDLVKEIEEKEEIKKSEKN